MGVIREITNYPLLRMSYKEKRTIKYFLRGWGALESLCYKGDTVAICILLDLKKVTGIDLDEYNNKSRKKFNEGYKRGKLSQYQYMAVAYCLVLGYSQEELAFVMGVDQSVISRNINSGIKAIQKELGAFEED
ncbi:hypothetical protein C3V36_11010 [Lachnospiraceae bacterium oral taxon 500]|nr:hypothetical protein C3V36_11010 [Lachnospiraceae bacterium oral taxon 500]